MADYAQLLKRNRELEAEMEQMRAARAAAEAGRIWAEEELRAARATAASLQVPNEGFWDLFSKLPDELALQVAACFPPGRPRGRFRQLSPRTRDLANALVAKAKVGDWDEAARMGARCPLLEELEVGGSRGVRDEPALTFLEHVAVRLPRLVSLDLSETHLDVSFLNLGGSIISLDLDLMLAVCRRLPQLQHLKLPLLWCMDAPPPNRYATAVVEAITQLQQLTSLSFQVGEPAPKDLALLQHLPKLRLLEVDATDTFDSGVLVDDANAAWTAGLRGLEDLRLTGSWILTPEGLVAALSGLLHLTCLELGFNNDALGPEGFAALAVLCDSLRCLHLWGPDGFLADATGALQLTRLRHLTQLILGRHRNLEGADVELLAMPSLRELRVHSISDDMGPDLLQRCQVTALGVQHIQPPKLVSFRSLRVLHVMVAPEVGSRMLQQELHSCGVTEMHIGGCMTQQLADFLVLPNVQDLSCPWLRTRQALHTVFKYTSVTNLFIEVDFHLAGDLHHLTRLTLLRRLTLRVHDGSGVAQAIAVGLGACTGLQHLTLSFTPELTDEGLEVIARRLPWLRSLQVQACPRTTARGLEGALALLAHLE